MKLLNGLLGTLGFLIGGAGIILIIYLFAASGLSDFWGYFFGLTGLPSLNDLTTETILFLDTLAFVLMGVGVIFIAIACRSEW